MKEKTDISLGPTFRAMADGTRLKMLLMLEGKPRTVGEIVSFFDLSQPTVTRHLQTLTAAGLVKRTRRGQHVFYELDAESLRSVCVELVACFPCCGTMLSSQQGLSMCTLTEKITEKASRQPLAGRDKLKPTKPKRKGGKS